MKKIKYLDNHQNLELKEYFKILCSSNFPYFINDYIEKSPELKRLMGVGQFCGVDYNNLKCHDTKYWYSRLDHSIACSLITWYLTQDKTQTIAALFHDVGTPAFAHSVDFMYEDYLKQGSSEATTDSIIKESKIIMDLLKRDNINYQDIINIEKYSIVECERPKICVDRLEGILSTGLVWGKYWSINDIEDIYKNIVILKDNNGFDEIGFNNIDKCEFFFIGAFKYSMLLQLNEDKMSMQLTADILNLCIQTKIIELNDLYKLSEKEIISKINNSNNEVIKKIWNKFVSLDKIEKSSSYNYNKYCINIYCKKRYVEPLVQYKEKNIRITSISNRARRLQEIYMNFNDSEYATIDLEPIEKIKRKM